MFRRVLVANRGEIAVRIIRTVRQMGIGAVAVYSDADSRAPHAVLADSAIRIGGAPAAESYLSIPSIIHAAQVSHAEAIHPGYGFLSENEEFARACESAGLVFIGPPASALALMGSKIAARAVARQAGVPVVPGEVPADQSDASLAAAVARVGFPVLVKPSAGGGGIGMHVVRDHATLAGAVQRARREAIAAFGDGTLYVERLIERPRHVEVQVLADNHGNVIHLFERECSVQRRHQKVIEETPSPAVTPGLRARLGEAAVGLARAAGYRNAGTVEFLLEGSGEGADFYFLEMNARLQVEHPITEAVTGLDLVRAQIDIASGERLAWPQESLSQRGHAIEGRIYAEDPARGYLPQAGPLLVFREPALPGVRVDAGVCEGGEVSVHYDPLMAKVIACGETREAARRRLVDALHSFPILGVRTNVAFLADVLEHPAFQAGDVDTHFLDQAADDILARAPAGPPEDAVVVAAAARDALHGTPAAGAPPPDPWSVRRMSGGSLP